MIKQKSRAATRPIFYLKLALRHWNFTERPIYHQTFWDALSGADRYDCDDFTDESKAREYFESARPEVVRNRGRPTGKAKPHER